MFRAIPPGTGMCIRTGMQINSHRPRPHLTRFDYVLAASRVVALLPANSMT